MRQNRLTLDLYSLIILMCYLFIHSLKLLSHLTVILLVMPLPITLLHFVIRLRYCTHDVAFPLPIAFSYFVSLLGGLFLYASCLPDPLFLAGMLIVAPVGGWFG